MKKTRFNFATVFSIMALLAYAFFAFMGLVYWKNGDIAIPLLLSLGGIVLILLCLYAMCRAKESRWKIGKVGQIFFGSIILIAFILAALPFTNFFNVVKNQNEIKGKIETLLTSAKNVDKAYLDYANDRIQKYEDILKLASEGKQIRPSDYNQLLANAAGENDERKIENLTKSLHRQLLPASMDSISKQRTEWIEKTNKMSVWNILLPSNINKIAKEVDNYVDNYTELSGTIRMGETVEPFTYHDINNDLGQLQEIYTKFSKPSFISILVSIFGFLIMLLPYFIAQRAMSKKVSKTGTDYE